MDVINELKNHTFYLNPTFFGIFNIFQISITSRVQSNFTPLWDSDVLLMTIHICWKVLFGRLESILGSFWTILGSTERYRYRIPQRPVSARAGLTSGYRCLRRWRWVSPCCRVEWKFSRLIGLYTFVCAYQWMKGFTLWEHPLTPSMTCYASSSYMETSWFCSWGVSSGKAKWIT